MSTIIETYDEKRKVFTPALITKEQNNLLIELLEAEIKRIEESDEKPKQTKKHFDLCFLKAIIS